MFVCISLQKSVYPDRRAEMTDTPLRECWDCGAHWPEDVMVKDSDENWYCKECHYPEPKPDLVDFMACKED
jgi:hypothetical protein